MGQQFSEISEGQQRFIKEQKLFFVGTAAAEGRVNVPPKGMESLYVMNKNRVIWLNVTGSGNETAAHVQQNKRMTIMFAAFEGRPLIMRLYGSARVIHQGDADWEKLLPYFEPLPGARQIFDLEVDLVQTSCGMAVPLVDYVDEREALNDWAAQKCEDGIKQYWSDNNQLSLDGEVSNIVSKSG